MKADEIIQMINKKGAVARDFFYGIHDNIKHDNILQLYDLNESDEDIAVLAFNFTISMMEFILKNPEYYERRCKIKERNRQRICKDLKGMERLGYPDDSPNIFDGYNIICLEKAIIRHYKNIPNREE